MRVKRLEIQGFKSFKDKTVIHFDHGITGIVGPNGCGKSNIVDAFFWVMGEQSYKHMRGNSSEDLIFNGSSKYSSLGMAEATMVLETDVIDNDSQPTGATFQDIPVHLRAKEISVTRRLYRSGEGEYFINGLPARLKDIQELFMDTGVGAKGYSVIEQGQIGKIVNAKPEDRRLLIEEAAGIAKYKARKKESLRKMDATQANLSRLNDVIQEIERSLNSLERQAQKARQYKKYKDELLDKEMTWGRRKYQVFRQKLEALSFRKEAFEQELVGLRAELQVAENTVETDRVSQTVDTKQAEDLQSQIQALSDQLAREQSALDLSRRRQNDLSVQLQTLESERIELEASSQEETAKLQKREAEATDSDQSLQTAIQKVQTLDELSRKARQEAEAVRRDLEFVKRELMNGVTRSSDLTSKAAALSGRIEAARVQSERLDQQLQSQAEKRAHFEEEAKKTESAALASRERRTELENERKAQQEKIREQDQAQRAAEQERQTFSKQLTQLRSRLESLKELDSMREGFGDGPKAVLEWAKTRKADQHFIPVADALDSPAEYESAIEGWLEGQLENLITMDLELAKQAIEQVQKDKQGRVGIQIASDAEIGPRPAFDVIQEAFEAAGLEVIGELSQLAKIHAQLEEPVRQAAARAINGVCLVKSLSPLQSMPKLQGWSVLALDGSALDHDGTLRGGHTEGNGATLLQRKRVIGELQSQIDESEKKYATLEQNAEQAKQALDLSRARLESLQAELQTIQVEIAGLDRDIHQINRALKDAQAVCERTEREIQETREQTEDARMEQQEIEASVAEFASFRAELEGKISAGEGELLQKDTEARAAEQEFQSFRVQEASIRERAGSLRRELESSRALIADRERRLNEIRRTLDRTSGERQQFTGSESGLERKIEELIRTLAERREELSQVKQRLEISGEKVSTALERIKEVHKALDQKGADLNQSALEAERISGELSHLVQNLEEKYGPGCLELPITSPIQEEMTAPVVTTEMSEEEEVLLGEEVERLRERIRRLGEVNVMAIEEFEELKKRHDYLLTEKQDLQKSIENLQEAIEHINRTSEERFVKAFEAIRDRFERLFPIIFGGGQAKLSLVYPEGSTDVLEAGVDILAQPPGKKVVNIGLLSGGEKALTAVSLIFAIFMVKPSPFCVLDEVDAPLDDANIGKFNALLREMSSKSQFILITHNKKTMELNDTLYGVTMEEPGVSKMVSIEMQ